MLDLDLRIQKLFPDAVNGVDYELRDVGDGPYIHSWALDAAQPTEAELLAVSTVTEMDVVIERERRLAAGFTYDFGDARGVHEVGTTDADMRGWEEVTQLANALLASGDTTTEIDIVTNTGPAKVTAPEWHQVLLAAAAFRQPIWAASFALQATETIPSDYTNDTHWAEYRP